MLLLQAPPPQVPLVSIPFVQLGVPHGMLLPGSWQPAATPLHCPLHSPLPVQAVLDGVPPVRGSPTMRRQVPSEVGSLHESHCALQSLLQQTPSAHLSEVHSLANVQVRPRGFLGVQPPSSQ